MVRCCRRRHLLAGGSPGRILYPPGGPSPHDRPAARPDRRLDDRRVDGPAAGDRLHRRGGRRLDAGRHAGGAIPVDRCRLRRPRRPRSLADPRGGSRCRGDAHRLPARHPLPQRSCRRGSRACVTHRHRDVHRLRHATRDRPDDHPGVPGIRAGPWSESSYRAAARRPAAARRDRGDGGQRRRSAADDAARALLPDVHFHLADDAADRGDHCGALRALARSQGRGRHCDHRDHRQIFG